MYNFKKEEQLRHTFLTQRGTWAISGTYIISEDILKVTGRSIIEHYPDKWIIDCTMHFENKTNSRIIYEIVPFKNSDTSTTWTATSPLGKLFGTFTLNDIRIIEDYHTQDQQYIGKEILTKIDDMEYSSDGSLYYKDEIKSSWTLNYTKQPIENNNIIIKITD